MSLTVATQKISAFVISYNRAEVIEACLRSIRFADELIVIDKGSTDGSDKIAARYADRVISVPWTPNVEETRAFALSQCSHDFIVFLDDDECFSPDCILYLLGQRQARDADIYAIPSRHHVLGRHDERAYYWPERQVRAFWRGAATFSNTVHTVAAFLSDKVAQIETDSGIFIHHLSHASARIWFEKTNRYTSIGDRRSSFDPQELRPLRRFAHSRIDHWLDAGSVEGDDYVDSVALMRATYDLIDGIKLVESSLGVCPEADFPETAAALSAGFDRFSAQTGVRTHGRPGQAETLEASPPEQVDAATQWRLVAQDAERLANRERGEAASLRGELEQARANLVDLGRIIADRDEQARTRDAAMARLDRQRQINESAVTLLTRQVDSLIAERDALSRQVEGHEAVVRGYDRRIRLAAIQEARSGHTAVPAAAGAPPPSPVTGIAGRFRRVAGRLLRPAPLPAPSVRDEIEASGAFDAAFYLATYADIDEAKLDPLDHYVDHGMAEGRRPAASFDPAFYAQRYPDAVGALPLVLHYIRHGRAEGRLGAFGPAAQLQALRAEIADSGMFDAQFYQSLYQDSREGGDDALDHFILVGLEEGRLPSAEFDPPRYADAYPDMGGPGEALLHYIRSGRAEGRMIDPAGFDAPTLPHIIAEIHASELFDAAFYRATNPVVEAERLDPLLHYLLSGFRGKCDIAASRPMHVYLAANPDLRNTGANPLLHWLHHGRAEGRDAPGALEEAVWAEFGRSERLPDNLVGFELLKGEAYFTAHRFSFDPARSGGLVEAAVAALARRQPLLTFDAAAPDVSIIIPVYGQVPFVLGCLDSLAAHRSRFTVEVLVVDDASPAATHVEVLASIPWIRLERRPRNSGFIDACNFGAEQARGRTLVLLNSDTRVVDGWLDELVGSFSLFPKAGLVGSKLFNADGTLQEAGGLFWRDGSAWNYGRGDDPNQPKYCFARRVDYVSGASIAVPAAIWQEMDGFDVKFRPAYCEDADLAFRLRRAGYETWYQPLSRVIHYEGKTHGRDLKSGIKAYQATNMQRILARYGSEMSQFAQNGVRPKREANRTAGPAMLVLDTTTHTPDRDAGSLVASRMMQVYRELGFSQTFLPLHDVRWKRGYSEAMQRIGVECHYLPYTSSVETLLAQDDGDFAVVLAYRYMIVRDTYDTIRRFLPATRLLFSNVDLHYLREEREAALKQSVQGAFKAAVTKTQELEVFARADCSLVHTPVEREAVQAAMPAQLDSIIVFPWIAEAKARDVAWDGRRDIMFLGGFRHHPNLDAMRFFTTDVWPLLEPALPPDARLLIVGDSPPDDVRLLAGERVVVTGYVTELEPYFDAARVFVAPLRFGAGIKGKLIEALSHGVPSVATSIAAEGIGMTPGRHVAIADDAAAFAAGVLRLYTDNEAWQSMRDEGLGFITANFSWERARTLCQDALDVADATWRARQQAALERRLKAILAEGGAQAKL